MGTVNGSLVYLNVQEQQMIKLVSRVSDGLNCCSSVSFDPSNQAVFLAAVGDHSSEVKLFATSTLD